VGAEPTVRILSAVKTRTLLLLAVVCGLVILVAGSIKVFLIADEKTPTQLQVGETATVGDMNVTVDSVERRDGQTLVAVELVGVDDPDGALSWVLGVVGAQLQPSDPPAGSGPACGATAQSTPTRCVLAFATDESRGVLRYERANETARWDISDTSS
jgi:hypothetical protein